MDPSSGTGPVRISNLGGKQMIECWTEQEDGRWDSAYGYVRAGSLGIDYGDYDKMREVNFSLIYRAEWSFSEEGFTLKVLDPHPNVPFPVEPRPCNQHVCCRGDH